mgnify:CR=1 FL=1
MKVLDTPPENLTIEHLHKIVELDLSEDQTLEFKSSDFLGRSAIAKEISAFLNTDGGVIIVGIAETDKSGLRLDLLDGEFDSERLTHLISSNIEPYQDLIGISEIRGKDGYAVVIRVDKSKNPPHLATHNSGTYYIRINETSQPAPHSTVEALFNQRQEPKIIPYIEAELETSTGSRSRDRVGLRVGYTNVGNVGAHDPVLSGDLPTKADYDRIHWDDDLQVRELDEKHVFNMKDTGAVAPNSAYYSGFTHIFLREQVPLIEINLSVGTITHGTEMKNIKLTYDAVEKLSSMEVGSSIGIVGKITSTDIEEQIRNYST